MVCYKERNEENKGKEACRCGDSAALPHVPGGSWLKGVYVRDLGAAPGAPGGPGLRSLSSRGLCLRRKWAWRDRSAEEPRTCHGGRCGSPLLEEPQGSRKQAELFVLEAGAACTGSWSQAQLLLPPVLSDAEQNLRWSELKDSLGSGLISCLSNTHAGRSLASLSKGTISEPSTVSMEPGRPRSGLLAASQMEPISLSTVQAGRRSLGGVQTSGLTYILRLRRAPEGFLNQKLESLWGALPAVEFPLPSPTCPPPPATATEERSGEKPCPHSPK